MSNDVTFTLNPADVAAFDGAIKRISTELKWTPQRATKFASVALGRSLGAATVLSKKTRKIVRNPDKSYRKLARQFKGTPVWGVMKYNKAGKQEWVPMRSQYGKPFPSKTTGKMLVRDLKTGAVHTYERVISGNLESGDKSDYKKHPLVKIARRGYAKSTWVFILRAIGKFSGSALQPDAARAVRVSQQAGRDDYKITMNNMLSYIRKAAKGGRLDVNAAMHKAGAGMMGYIDRKLAGVIK
jgi:hypothetical protein